MSGSAAAFSNQYPPTTVDGRYGQSSGFTLVELLVVIAVMGLLVSIAISSYQNYVTSASVATVSNNYGEAVRAVRNQFAAADARRANGAEIAGTVPSDISGWLAILNPSSAQAPGGTPAYEQGLGNGTFGSIGIEVTGSFAGGDLQVTVNQPAFADMEAKAETISQSS